MKSILRMTAAVIVIVTACLGPGLNAQSWTNTSTRGLVLNQAIDLGPLPPTDTMNIIAVLQVQNRATLQQYILNINDPNNPQYGQSLTPAQFAASYAPGAAQVQSVTAYLRAQGFQGIAVEPNNLFVDATGTVAQVNAAFNTNIEQFSQNGQTVFANTATAQVPGSLSGLVVAVLGLTNAGKMQLPLHTQQNSIPDVGLPNYPASYTPQGYWTAYNANGVTTGSRTNIAIFAEGNVQQVITDLRLAETAFGLSQVPLQVVQVGIPSTDTSGADEFDMDTQYSTGMAGTVKKLYIYDTTSLSDSDVALMFSRFATDNLAKAGSASFGLCEIFAFLDGSMLADDEVFLEAAAQGQTVFASTGDTGGFCPVEAGTNGVPAGAPFVNYPAASPYVVAVGGTTLVTNTDGSYDEELAWYAGGGGISQFEGTSYWQTAAQVPSSQINSKGLPDVSMVADPYSGVTIYLDGTPQCCYGGTSLSSPLALGVWARMLTENPRLGFASPRLYSLYDGTTIPGSYPQGGFHDITLGVNSPYPATPGWDYATGLGSLWVSQLATDLRR
ncbi:MAG TPA: S53 family peptidase [Candidatus Binatia bacterium]|nr:S53 family peptidase [Candidatus Binatia bacterium]